MKWWLKSGMLQQEHLTVQSDLIMLNQVMKWFEQFCLRNLPKLSWLERQRDKVPASWRDRIQLGIDELKLALDEAFTNVVRHAHKHLPTDTLIDIEVTLWDDRLEIRLWDYGEPFDPSTIEEFKPGTLQEGKIGWFLIRRITDQAFYERCQDGRNCLIMVKHKCKK